MQDKESLAPIRVELLNGQIHISTQVELLAGKLFEPKWYQCQYGELPIFIADKIALLRTAGRGVFVDGMGKWRGDKLYYVEVSPKQWNQYHESKT